MKRSKLIISAVVAFIAIITPILLLLATTVLIPSQYKNSFVGVLDEKYDRLASIEGPKCVVIGGSSVAFGLDSEKMGELIEMPVVNFGLYAAIGTKAMIDLSRDQIKEGDVVILAPELDPQTLSMYFSSRNTLEAIDGDYSLAFKFDIDTILSLFGGLWRHGAEKLGYFFGETPDPTGVYNGKNFNEYGDVVWDRPENVMQFYYDPTTPIDLSPSIVEPEFIDYVNEYIAYCESKGATVYFSWCPMNALSVKNPESASDFQSFMESKLNCDFISDINSYVIAENYFFDTNYHLNDAGVLLRTRQLVEDIFIANGKFVAVDIEVPEPPALPQADTKFFDEDENDKYFTYRELPNGALEITGLTDLGKTMETLTIPLGAEYKKVTTLGEGAFAGGVAKKVIITADTNLRNILDNVMKDSGVTDIWIYYVFDDYVDPTSTLKPPGNFYEAENTTKSVNVHLTRDSIYTTHYDWNDSSKGRNFVYDIEPT